MSLCHAVHVLFIKLSYTLWLCSGIWVKEKKTTKNKDLNFLQNKELRLINENEPWDPVLGDIVLL